MKIFVYGALSKSMRRFGVLRDSQFMGNGFAQGIFYDVSVYPATRKGSGAIYGEIYEMDEKKIRELDTIEGYRPEDKDQSLYIRKEVDIVLSHDGSQEKASAYFFNYDNGVLLMNQMGR
jgi:gamma-glutamylcyclotransferase (GGCT)/AIG2-like uncharacterized protein YtfP